MKTITSFLISIFLLFCVSLLNAQTYNITSTANNDGYFSALGTEYSNDLNIVWNINLGVAKPVQLEYFVDIEDGTDYLLFYAVDNNNNETLIGSFTGNDYAYISTNLPTGKAKVVFITDGEMCYDYGFQGIECTVYEDNNFQSTTNTVNTIFNKDIYGMQNAFILGKVGVGTTTPKEKLEVNGSAIIQNRLGVGTSPYNGKFSVSNSSDNIAFNCYSHKNSTSSLYGIYSTTYNYSGPVYGIYSSVIGVTGKKWAGYFTGGDVTVTNGNLGAGVESPLGILHVRGTGDNAWVYFGSNAGFTKPKPKINYGLAFTYNLSGSEGENIISYSGGPRLEFTKWDGSNLVTEMTLKTGSLGIGTKDPKSKLDVQGEINMLGRIGMSINDASQCFTYDSKSMGHYSLGWLQESQCTNSGPSLLMSGYGGVKLFTTGQQRFAITANGKVGIGLANPDVSLSSAPADEMLTVNGTIHAKEVRVDLTGSLADYVFSPTYSLRPLTEVEAFVKENQHLPEIPSAAEVKEKGLSMGEMQNKLLQKIEELTLYVIELKKINDIQQLEIEKIKSCKK